MNKFSKATIKNSLIALTSLFFQLNTNVLYAQADPKIAAKDDYLSQGYTCYGKLAKGVPNAEKLGWKVGIQAYCFNKFTFFEAIDMTAALGLHYIEAVSGMRMAPGSDVKFGAGLSQEWKDKLQQKLKDADVQLVSFYQWMNGSGEGFEDVVKFAKELNLTIVTDPKRAPDGKPSEYYDNILKKYGVTMVFTNHPKPIAYWNPEYALEDTKGRSKYLGASVDIGHYMRAGFPILPIVQNNIKAGRMYHFHFRDVSEVGKDGVDVTVGEGKGQIKEVLTELAKNKVQPLIMLEYEKDFYNPLLELIPSIEYINKIAGELK